MLNVNIDEIQDIINGSSDDIIKEICIIKKNKRFDMLDTAINVAAFLLNEDVIIYCQEDFYNPILVKADVNSIDIVFNELIKQKLLEIEKNNVFEFEILGTCNFVFRDASVKIKEDPITRIR